jgi:hypothetical protein
MLERQTRQDRTMPSIPRNVDEVVAVEADIASWTITGDIPYAHCSSMVTGKAAGSDG